MYDLDECELETEVEWRARITLLDSQRVLQRVFRGEREVFCDEYRIKRCAKFQIRVGMKYKYDTPPAPHETYGEFMQRQGLDMNDQGGTKLGLRVVKEVGNVKSTNCVHALFVLPRRSELVNTNRWPKIVAMKRAIEVAYKEDTTSLTTKKKRARSVEEKMAEIEAYLERFERDEMNCSDNNLGILFVRKMYFYKPLRDGRRLRVALYSFFDEYQQVRHELSVEVELDRRNDVVMLPSKYTRHVESATQRRTPVSCLSRLVGKIALSQEKIRDILENVANSIDKLVAYVEYVEKPFIKIDIDWLPGITSPSNVVMMSYSTLANQSETENGFVAYMKNLLENKIQKRCERSKYEYVIRRKLDGKRVYATFDGRHSLALSTSNQLDLRRVFPRRTNFDHLFSIDFVYQFEQVNDDQFFLTEVVSIRHSYTTVLNPLNHSYGPSRNFYSSTKEQAWPYGLIVPGMPDHVVQALMEYWVCSGCKMSISSSPVVKKFVEGVRSNRLRLTNDEFEWSGEEDEEEAEDDTAQDEDDEEQQQDDDTAQRDDDDDNVDDEEDDEEGEEDDDGKKSGDTKTETTAPIQGPSKAAKTDESVNYSNFFVPITAKDSQSMLLAIQQEMNGENEERGMMYVNAPLKPNNALELEIREYYVSFILRLLNVLFLTGEHDRCATMIYKHFSIDRARAVCKHYKEQRRCMPVGMEINGIGQTKLDGYLVYRYNREEEVETEMPLDGTFCALPKYMTEEVNVRALVLKVKPFQSIELLLRIMVTDQKDEVKLMLSSRNDSEAPTNDDAIGMSNTMIFETCRKSTVDQRKRSNIKWTRYDGNEVYIFIDPRLTLRDGVVYELICYTERELFMTDQRHDKILPDDETKINGIIWNRHAFDDFFV